MNLTYFFYDLYYQGQTFDRETGLAYNRYYDPEQGNYISQDPIGLASPIPVIGAMESEVLVYHMVKVKQIG